MQGFYNMHDNPVRCTRTSCNSNPHIAFKPGFINFILGHFRAPQTALFSKTAASVTGQACSNDP